MVCQLTCYFWMLTCYFWMLTCIVWELTGLGIGHRHLCAEAQARGVRGGGSPPGKLMIF